MSTNRDLNNDYSFLQRYAEFAAGCSPGCRQDTLDSVRLPRAYTRFTSVSRSTFHLAIYEKCFTSASSNGICWALLNTLR